MARDPFLFAHTTEDIVWMSQNTNSIPTSPEIEDRVKDALDQGKHHLYPYSKGIPGLPEAILDDHQLDQDGWAVHIASGCIEALDMANRSLVNKGDEVLAADPSFLPIHHQVQRLGGTVMELPIYQDPYRLTSERVQEHLHEDMAYVLLIDPINPIGTPYPPEEVRAIAELCQDAGVPLIHDVTYRDFSPDHVLATEWYPEGTIVAFSFSKWAGLAGLRVGGVIAAPDTITGIKRYDPNVLGCNVLAQTAALAALETKPEWLPEVLKEVEQNQADIKDAVEKVEGCFIPVYPSRANMLLIDISATGVHPDDVQERMLEDHKVFVRSGTYVSKTVGERFIRISFTIPNEEVQRFCEAFPVVMDQLRS